MLVEIGIGREHTLRNDRTQKGSWRSTVNVYRKVGGKAQ